MKSVAERAPTGRSKCRACGKAIARGDLRFGELVPNSFGEGETTLWYHPTCAACSRPECARAALDVSAEPIAEREWLEGTIAHGLAHPRVQRLARAERSVSGRAHCRRCKETIALGAWRIALHIFEEWRFAPLGYVHASCAAPYFETSEVAPRLARLCPDLSVEDVAEIDALVRSAPSDAPGLAKTTGGEPEPEAKQKNR
ncbi:MAG TPA: hypothetical protein VGI10_15220 [Polyangiaceae bacterium]|jgi:hypothetical protein